MAFNEVLRLVLDIDAAHGKRELDDFTKKTSTNLNRVGSTMTRVGGTLTRQVTLPLVALGAVATKMAADFDTSFVRMQTLAGVSAREVDGLKESVLGLAGETGKAPNELAEALFYLSSAGLNTADAMDALEMSARASALGMGSTIDIANAVSSAMNAYAKSGLSAAEAVDVLVATARAGKAEPAELAAQMGRVLPVASELKISFEDVGAAIAALSLAGNDAAMSTTQLTNLLSKILKPSKQALDLLDGVGLSLDDIQDMVANGNLLPALEELRARLGDNGFAKFLEDQQAVLAGLALTGENVAKNREIFDQLHDSTGALDNAFSTWADSMGAKNARAFADLQVAMIEFGDVLAPVVSSVLGFVGDLVSVFSDLPQPMQNVVVGVLAFAAALGPLMSIGGNVVSFVGNLTKLTGSLGGAIGSTSLAAGGLVAILGIAAMTVFAFKQRQAEAEKVANDFADALSRSGEQAKVAADDIIIGELAAGDLGNKMREAGTDLTVFTDEIRAGGDAAEDLADRLHAAKGAHGLYGDELRDTADAGSVLAQQLVDLADAEDLSEEEVLNLLESMSQLSDRYAEGAAQADTAAFSQEQLAGEVENAGLAFDEQGNLIDDATSALQEYAEQLAATYDPIFAMADALRENQDAAANLRLRQQELSTAVRDYGADSSEAFESQQALTEAQVEARDSVLNLETAALGLQDAITTGGLSVAAARDEFIAMATQMGFTGAEAAILADDFGLAADEANRLAGDRAIKFSTPGASTAIYDIDRIRAKLDNLTGSLHVITVAVETKGGVLIPGSGGSKRFHEGGVVPGRRGEEVAAVLLGQEEVLAYDDPRHSANLARNVAPAYVGMSAGGGATARVVIDITGGDDQLLRWLRNRVRVEGRGDVQIALGQRR